MTTPISTNDVLTKDVPAQLFFLFDSHCPWSYVATRLINEINNAFPDITLNLWHTAFFDGKSNESAKVRLAEIKEVEKLADIDFSNKYHNIIDTDKNSILSAN